MENTESKIILSKNQHIQNIAYNMVNIVNGFIDEYQKKYQIEEFRVEDVYAVLKLMVFIFEKDIEKVAGKEAVEKLQEAVKIGEKPKKETSLITLN